MIKFIFIALLAAIMFVNACSDSPEPAREMTTFTPKSSELAEMMRQMHIYTKHLAVNIKADSLTNLPPYHHDWDKLKTATPTDPSVRTVEFNVYSDQFVQSLEKLHNQKQNRIFNYNNVVDNCVSCHRQYCPGPIKTINKLKI